MNINPIILFAALLPALLIFWLARKYDWESKLTYHIIVAIIGIIGVLYFTYSIIQQFNLAYLMINILLFFGVVQKILKILLIKKEEKQGRKYGDE